MTEQLLSIKNLHVNFKTEGGQVKAVRGAGFDINRGEIVAVVGESGCGKSVTAQSVMGLIPEPPGKIKEGTINFDGRDLLNCSARELRKVRGGEIGMIFQDPMTSLNPTMKVGKQLMEGLRKHKKMSKSEAKAEAVSLLKKVGIPAAEERFKQYPHEFSGGMRQRVMIAIALACKPKLLIADEPTTALDVTIQAQIMELMKELQKDMGMSILLITHDLAVVAEVAEKVVVMYAGQVVETGTVEEIMTRPKHPYTEGLLKAVPTVKQNRREALVSIPGAPPDLFAPPAGCAFAARCPYAMEACLDEMPAGYKISETHQARCWLNDPDAPTPETILRELKEA